jgi:hypothetical protein
VWSIDDGDDVRRSATVTSRRDGLVAAVRAALRWTIVSSGASERSLAAVPGAREETGFRHLGLADGSSDLVHVHVLLVEEPVRGTGGHGVRADHVDHAMTGRAVTVHAPSFTMTTEARRELLQTERM